MILEVDKVSKVYRKGVIGSGSFAKEWEAKLKGFWKGNFRGGIELESTHKSLDEVSFSVQAGDRVGIIGKNGAGKSTLLKLISRITTPTSGEIRGKGRVASLLEVGTGFHPELTGLENIYLNGSILGMGKEEIEASLSGIISFSGVDSYIHTPVKRYSSGMYVRLAFAIAAHLQSELLIVDEVLAVGDFEFQKQCIEKMRELSLSQGRTILFVSHNLHTIASLCNKCLLLEQGKVKFFGQTDEAIQLYKESNKQLIPVGQRKDRKGSQQIKLEELTIHSGTQIMLSSGLTLKLQVQLNSSLADGTEVDISIGINNEEGLRLTLIGNTLIDEHCLVEKGINSFEFEVAHCPLPMGNYTCTVFISKSGEIFDWVQDAISFDILGEAFFPSGNSLPKGQGFFYLPFSMKKL